MLNLRLHLFYAFEQMLQFENVYIPQPSIWFYIQFIFIPLTFFSKIATLYSKCLRAFLPYLRGVLPREIHPVSYMNPQGMSFCKA